GGGDLAGLEAGLAHALDQPVGAAGNIGGVGRIGGNRRDAQVLLELLEIAPLVTFDAGENVLAGVRHGNRSSFPSGSGAAEHTEAPRSEGGQNDLHRYGFTGHWRGRRAPRTGCGLAPGRCRFRSPCETHSRGEKAMKSLRVASFAAAFIVAAVHPAAPAHAEAPQPATLATAADLHNVLGGTWSVTADEAGSLLGEEAEGFRMGRVEVVAVHPNDMT